VVHVSDDRFEELVEEALAQLPEHLARAIDNVAITIDVDAPVGDLLGEYHGIPLTERDSLSYSGVMPDEVTLFKNTICAVCADEDELRHEVRVTVIHEIGHHFGVDDDRLDELGWG
jgi:predicted Zn-dependent protease with MMP-like domain